MSVSVHASLQFAYVVLSCGFLYDFIVFFLLVCSEGKVHSFQEFSLLRENKRLLLLMFARMLLYVLSLYNFKFSYIKIKEEEFALRDGMNFGMLVNKDQHGLYHYVEIIQCSRCCLVFF